MAEANQTAQQVAQTLLNRAAWKGNNLEFWLTELMPYAIQHIEQNYNSQAAGARVALALTMGLPGLRQNFGSVDFERDFELATTRINYSADFTAKEHFNVIREQRAKFYKARDFHTVMRMELLPMLKAVRDGEPVEKTHLQSLTEFTRESMAFYDTFVKEVPTNLQADLGAQTYNRFSADMKELQKAMNTELGVSPPVERQIESEHYKPENRLKDSWKGLP